MSSEVVLKVEGVGKRYEIYEAPHHRLLQTFLRGRKQFYKEFWALQDISFEVKRGETLGIIGRNGSGKSTLLQIIAGTLAPTTGRVSLAGKVAALLELGSGFNPDFTGRENVFMSAAVLGLTSEETGARFESIAAFADIGEFIEQPVKTYSSGMMLRLAFAVIAHVDADILVIDEALAVGDAFFSQKCMRFLRDFMKKGTVLFVSHDMGSVKNLCNAAVWLEKGRVLQAGAPKQVCELYLEAFYEVQQGKSSTTKLKALRRSDEQPPVKDQRLAFINASNLRNDIQIFKFDPEAAFFGKGEAQIHDVRLLDEKGDSLAWIVGGEKVTLRALVRAHQDLGSPIVGFYVKDRLGQALFGDNTYLTFKEQPVDCPRGHDLQADFSFFMPLLPTGEYSVTIAIASGTQEAHVQHHWIHDALLFRSEASSVTAGLIGVPLLNIQLQNLGMLKQ